MIREKIKEFTWWQDILCFAGYILLIGLPHGLFPCEYSDMIFVIGCIVPPAIFVIMLENEKKELVATKTFLYSFCIQCIFFCARLAIEPRYYYEYDDIKNGSLQLSLYFGYVIIALIIETIMDKKRIERESLSEVKSAWNDVINSLPQPRLKKAMTEAYTRYIDNEIHILVENHAQKLWLDEQKKDYLQNQLRLKANREVCLYFEEQEECNKPVIFETKPIQKPDSTPKQIEQEILNYDYHVITKVALVLLMTTTVLDGITTLINEGTGATFVISILILFSAIRTWRHKNTAFVFMLILFVCRLFIIDTTTDIAYSYLLGANFAKLLRDLCPFLATLFIKNNGISGWNVLFRNEKVKSITIKDDKEHKVKKAVKHFFMVDEEKS